MKVQREMLAALRYQEVAMRRLLVLPVLTILMLALAFPAAAGKPVRFVVDLGTPANEASLAAALTSACGTPISVAAQGKVIIIVLDKPRPRGVVEINAYEFHALVTNVATGATTTIVDAGPDRFMIDPKTGHLLLAITGRSTTGSGVIGRFVIDLDTGEVVAVTGLDLGDPAAAICAEIT
jgi:hypothetical protein